MQGVQLVRSVVVLVEIVLKQCHLNATTPFGLFFVLVVVTKNMGKQTLHDKSDANPKEHKHVIPEVLIKSINRIEDKNRANFSRSNRMRFRFVL